MAHPTVTATLDKSTYESGDTMVLTVVYGTPDPPGMGGMMALFIDTSAIAPLPES